MDSGGMNALIHAILSLACRDYELSRRYLMRPPEKQKEYIKVQRQLMLMECKHFFESEWFAYLTDMDGKKLMRMIDENGYYANNFAVVRGSTGKESTYSRKKSKNTKGSKRRELRLKEVQEYEKRKNDEK